MDFDIKKILKEFHKEYDFVSKVVYDDNSEVAGMREAFRLFEDLHDNKDFVKLIQDISKARGDFFDSSVEISSLMFALDNLGILDYFD